VSDESSLLSLDGDERAGRDVEEVESATGSLRWGADEAVEVVDMDDVEVRGDKGCARF